MHSGFMMKKGFSYGIDVEVSAVDNVELPRCCFCGFYLSAYCFFFG